MQCSKTGILLSKSVFSIHAPFVISHSTLICPNLRYFFYKGPRTVMSDTEKVEPTPEGIANYIRKRTHEVWEQQSSALFLSNISPELLLRGVNYKEVLPKGTTLKQFVSTLDDLRIVAHPLQKAKVGVVPKESPFTFKIEPTVGPSASSETPKKSRQLNQRVIVSQFLAALSRLSEEEIKQVTIPVHILARLMEDK